MRHPDRVIPYADERWYQLLHQACEESSITAVAARLGYKRARISQVINGIVVGNAKPDNVAARVIDILDARHCPYLNTAISPEDCRAMHAGETPSHNPAHLAHRRMCRTCQHKGGK